MSYTQVFDVEPAGNGAMKWYRDYTAATHYTYDIHGNVDTLLQDYNTGIMSTTSNRFKMIAYNYDLISGKVNMVQYQPPVLKDGKLIYPQDYFVHRYQYDAENRLTDVETSRDKMVWEKIARFDYYKHGPLANTITGQQQIQSVTNAYTLDGWIKGTIPNANYSNRLIAQSAFNYSLGYYAGDYRAINGSDIFASTSLPEDAEAKSLYNGNISSMLVNLPKIGESVLHTYRYDQLSRLKQVNNYKSYNAGNHTWQHTPEHKEELTFDPNGNIQKALLNGNNAKLNFEDFNYNYDPVKKNKLLSITNSINNTTSNYEYDEIGNLTKDELEGNAEMEWNIYGKLTKLKKEFK